MHRHPPKPPPFPNTTPSQSTPRPRLDHNFESRFCEIWHHQRHQRHAALIWEAFSRNAHNHEVSSRTKPFDCLWELHTIDETHPSELYQRSAPLGQRSGKHTLFADVSLRVAAAQHRATRRRMEKDLQLRALRHPQPPMPELYLRSEEHTSELQSQSNLVCRLLLEKKKDRRPHALVHRAGDGAACPRYQAL